MKSKLPLIILFAWSTMCVNAQGGFDILYDSDGNGPKPPSQKLNGGDTLKVNVTDKEISLHFIIKNLYKVNKQLQIARKRVNVPQGWEDNICWPPTCFPTKGVVFYTTPNSNSSPAPVILAEKDSTTYKELAEIKPMYKNSGSQSGTAHFRYLLMDSQTEEFVDSFDVFLNYTLNLNSLKSLPLFSMNPNPADQYASISLNSNEASPIRIMDALGKTVVSETIFNGSRNIDVSDLKNGVYIVLVEVEGKTINRKLIIRH